MIVNVSSVAATLSSPGEAAYDASKAALSVFSEAMAIDLWETGVRVLVVYPGVVDTELFDDPRQRPLVGGHRAHPRERAGGRRHGRHLARRARGLRARLVQGDRIRQSVRPARASWPERPPGCASRQAADASWRETGGGRPTSVDPEPDVSRRGAPTCPASTAGAARRCSTPRPPPGNGGDGDGKHHQWDGGCENEHVSSEQVVGMSCSFLRPRQSGCRTSGSRERQLRPTCERRAPTRQSAGPPVAADEPSSAPSWAGSWPRRRSE